jgi:hypothetical protein
VDGRHQSSFTTGRDEVLVRITVQGVGGRAHEDDAQVVLLSEGKRIELERPEGSLSYEASAKPGTYQLEVSAGRLVSPSRLLEVGPQGKIASVYLGEPDWPFYRLGENAIPFPPPGDLLAVAFPIRRPSPADARRLAGQIVQRLSVDMYPPPGKEAGPRRRRGRQPRAEEREFSTADGAIWLFRFTQPATRELRNEAARMIRELVGEEARIGVPVDLTPDQVKIIDNHFVIRFRDEVNRGEIEERLRTVESRILRAFIQSPNAFLVEFPAGDFLAPLEIVEEWYQDGLLVYGEPDIMAQLIDDAFPDDSPNDPTYPSQNNLTIQQVDVAWRIMHALGPNFTLGGPNVQVATLDRGVDLDHPDIGGNLTDGNPQISRCFDFSGMRECTVAGYAPDTAHGMGVYGIIAARTDNGDDIAGIASNTHQIALERPNLTSANYPDVLLWAAGFTTGNGTSGWPAEPLSPAAAIISCSHGSDGLALSGIMDDTLRELANNGRGGLGTLVVYSTGNSDTLITGFRTWAAHPNTLAIANSMQPDGGGVERRDPTSNFGPEVDVCAQGTGAPSLNDTGGEQIFGGTSAAAPTVAAVAALMLSKDPALTWQDLRDILRETAVQIDAANTDPVGQWVSGFSQWYGFGRVNAASAVCGVEPIVTLQTLSINFNDIPESETTVRAAVFSVESCHQVTLQIVGGPSAPFTTPMGTVAELDPSGEATPRAARLWIGYTGTTDGDTDSGSVTIRWVETGQDWTVPISANTVSRPTACLELVLDQSASMTFNSGIPALPQRVDVLKFSVPPLLEVIHEDNGLGVVRFDHDAYDAAPIMVAGPPVFGAGRVAARTAVNGHVPNPAGNTAIGDGVELAHNHLMTETDYEIQAMIVLTDGHETASKYISDVTELINERVYAIGLGTAEQIQPAALTALTNGTGGYLLLTGELGTTDYFLLAKYYLQILAGVTNEDIVLDPQGSIASGHEHRIPFRLNETDISSDVLLLTPAPGAIRFAVQTPAGDLVTPALTGGLPGASYVVGQNISYYRFTLPVPIGSGAGAGQWYAVLNLDDSHYKRYLSELEKRQQPAVYRQVATHGVPYSLSVHAYSNLRLRASLAQNSLEPGATLTLRAVLTEYGLPVSGRATVRAQLVRPDGTEATLSLPETEPAIFESDIVAPASGVYRFKVQAKGRTQRHRPFTREQMITGAVWRGGDDPFPTSADPADGDKRWCALLRCILSRGVMSKDLEQRLVRLGIDVNALRRCVEHACRGQALSLEQARAAERLAAILVEPQVAGLMRKIAEMDD